MLLEYAAALADLGDRRVPVAALARRHAQRVIRMRNRHGQCHEQRCDCSAKHSVLHAGFLLVTSWTSARACFCATAPEIGVRDSVACGSPDVNRLARASAAPALRLDEPTRYAAPAAPPARRRASSSRFSWGRCPRTTGA